MRSRTSHAAKSGVGEHKARESESAQPCAVGKECVASTHKTLQLGGQLFLQLMRRLPACLHFAG